jgi:hypothetical protein
MLSRRDKKRIKDEEAFRATLQAAGRSSNRLWAFLNSPLGIWFLSVVVIGTLTWSYAQWQVLKSRAEEIYKLDVEVDARLSKVQYASLHFAAYPNTEPAYYPVRQLLLPPGTENAIHAEYANRNLKSLLYELKSKVPFNDQWKLVEARIEIEKLEELPLDKQMNVQEALAFQQSVHEIRELRWGWTMTERSYEAYYSPVRVLAYSVPSFMIPFAAFVVLGALVFLGYQVVRRIRRTT